MGRLLVIIALCASTALAQQTNGTLRGQVLDEFGGAIIGATVVAVDAKGTEKTVTTNDQGMYVLSGLAPGKYTLRVAATGFAVYENSDVDVTTGRGQPFNVTLKVTIEQTKVTVASDSQALSTEPENNAGAVVLKGSDLESLPDDPDDLAAALQALAGPSAGPNGGQIFVDGFTGSRLPPRSSIREIRINSNPFSAEYDRLGFGRIEILTKPGTDKFRGSASFSFNDSALNSRNPFSPNRPPYQQRQYGGNLSGPISKKKSSFFFDFEKRDINDDAVINATILDSNLNILGFGQTVATPSRRTSFSPRIDYQINANNTLVARYGYEHSRRVTGVGGFSLASRKYDTANTEHNVQVTETAIINKKIVNETRLQFTHEPSAQDANNTIPTTNVPEAFIGGGSQIGLASNTQNRWEFQNNTSLALATQALKFGARVRHISITDISPQNFGGTWTFNGALAPQLDANNEIIPGATPVQLTSIQRYQRTLLLQRAGFSAFEIRKRGGGPTQFSIAAGNPAAAISQFDFGGYIQDDWKVRPNLTVNLGLRYENQDNIRSNYNFAPRVGFAWSPRAGGGKPAKTVVRGGFGIFYDRIGEGLTLTSDRFNGLNQQQYLVNEPPLFDKNGNYVAPLPSPMDAYPVQPSTAIPSVATLKAFSTPISIYRLARDIQAPYTMQSVISVERQLPHNFTVAVSFIDARSLHLLRARAINAPLPGTFVPNVSSGVRPLGTNNNIFEYESSGRFNQRQFIVNVSERLSRNSTLNAFYVFARASSDTDGAGSFPANSYDLTGEYARSSQDVRHRFVMIGNFRAPWGISLNPFVIGTSGAPFNITLGRDLNGDTLFTERPAFATDLTKPGVIITRWGAFDPNPTPGERIIPRNFGTGPGSLSTNLRISKTFGFGRETASVASGQGNRGEGGGGGRGPGMGGGMGVMVMGGGGPRGGGERGGGGGGGSFGAGGNSGRRYNLTVSINFQNLLNHANLGKPVGNISSQLFGISTTNGGNFGGFGGGPNSGAYNRRVEAQVRFSF